MNSQLNLPKLLTKLSQHPTDTAVDTMFAKA